LLAACWCTGTLRKYLRSDRELQQESLPRWLKGLCDGWLAWRSPETLALDRQMQKLAAERLAAEHEALNSPGFTG